MIKTLEELKKDLSKMHFFGECRIYVSNTEDGDYKLVIVDYSKYDLVTLKGELIEKDYEENLVRLTFYASSEGVIDVIEHGFGIFTKVNAREVAYVVSFIGTQLNVDELNNNLSKD